MKSLDPNFVESFCGVLFERGVSEKDATDMLMQVQEAEVVNDPDFREGFNETVKNAFSPTILGGLGLLAGGGLYANHKLKDRSGAADWTLEKDTRIKPTYSAIPDIGIGPRYKAPDPTSEYDKQLAALTKRRESVLDSERFEQEYWNDPSRTTLEKLERRVKAPFNRYDDSAKIQKQISKLQERGIADRAAARNSLERNIEGGVLPWQGSLRGNARDADQLYNETRYGNPGLWRRARMLLGLDPMTEQGIVSQREQAMRDLYEAQRKRQRLQ
jgi:hypothetical protein